MAIASNTIWEVRTGGNDTNGGGFVSGASGTDYSQQDNKNTATGTDDSTTDAVANGTTTITSATANFGTSIVGNIISLSGGTGSLTQTWRQVVSRTNATTIVVDASVAAGTGITMNIGGALASPGGVGRAAPTTGNAIYFQSGTYTINVASNNVPNGRFSNTGQIYLEGYGSARGDMGTRPVFQNSGVTGTLVNITGIAVIKNIIIDGGSLAAVTALTIRGQAFKITAQNVTGAGSVGFQVSTATHFIACYADTCTTGFNMSTNCSATDCIARACAGPGFTNINSSAVLTRCISYGNTTANGFGFSISGENAVLSSCVAYGNAKDGFNFNGSAFSAYNCIAEANTENGFELVAGHLQLQNCAVYNNTAGNFNIGTDIRTKNYGSITGTGTFFTSAGTGDFSLNNNANGGALLRETAFVGPLVNGVTTSYLDIGAVQHQGGGSGGGGEHSAVF